MDTDSVLAELTYEDPAVALAWLAEAFGFETRIIVADDTGRIVFAETGWGEQTVAIVPEDGDRLRSPRELGGVNTQMVRMRSGGDVNRHCAQARAAGAVIVTEPQDLFFGDRAYLAADLEGHLWSFSQRIPGAGGPPPPGWTVRFPSRAGEAA